jgi:hypothetical protein
LILQESATQESNCHKRALVQEKFGTANGNRTRILALKERKQNSKMLDLRGFLTIPQTRTCCSLL